MHSAMVQKKEVFSMLDFPLRKATPPAPEHNFIPVETATLVQ